MTLSAGEGLQGHRPRGTLGIVWVVWTLRQACEVGSEGFFQDHDAPVAPGDSVRNRGVIGEGACR